MTSKTVKNIGDNSVISTETFTYDAAGNITDAPCSCFQYDTNNRLISFNGNAVSYDLDGNMTSDGVCSYSYDSANRLTSHGGHTYTYNAEDVRIRNLCTSEDTTYTYDVNCKLNRLLCKTTNGTVTKYVYGLGLIGAVSSGSIRTAVGSACFSSVTGSFTSASAGLSSSAVCSPTSAAIASNPAFCGVTGAFGVIHYASTPMRSAISKLMILFMLFLLFQFHNS